jgi:hypothetical protein
VDIQAFIDKRVSKQLWLPFVEYYEPPKEKEDTVILFHLPMLIKKTLSEQASIEGLSVTGLLNALISDYISRKLERLKQAVKPKTGRGNINLDEIKLAKEFLRKNYPKQVRIVDLANYCGVKQARAARLVDLLSGGENKGDSASDEINDSFLVWQDDDTGKVGIWKDDVLGIKP